MFRVICNELADILERKNRDYGDSFSKSINKYGLVAAIVRMNDKFERIENLIKLDKDPEVSESLEDTLKDLAGYAILTLRELQKKKPNCN